MDNKQFYRNSCFESKNNISPTVLAYTLKKQRFSLVYFIFVIMF